MHEARSTAADLSDADLLRTIALLARRERDATVDLILLLAELDDRKLHLAEGYGSLFAYCTGALRLSEHAAYNRIEAARLCRRLPAVLQLLAEGALNLATARLLSPHLRTDNYETLVAKARGRSKREVEEIVAALAPRPDVASSVRRLPDRTFPVKRDASPPSTSAAGPVTTDQAGDGHLDVPDSLHPVRAEGVTAGPTTAPSPRLRPSVTPLAPQRYLLKATIGAATQEKLRRAQDLLRREIPDGDPGTILDRALTLLLEDVARRKVAQVDRPGRRPGGGTRSRHIPAQVKRAVWLRDGSRCAFVATNGRRCTERAFLEFHHREPYAIGGEATTANIALRCRAHNVHEARLLFGRTELAPGRVACRAQSALVHPG